MSELRLLELVRSQVAAAREGRWDDVDELAGEWREAVSSLGAGPVGRWTLVEAQRLTTELEKLAGAGLAAVGDELGTLGRGRTALAGYRSGLGAAAGVPALDERG